MEIEAEEEGEEGGWKEVREHTRKKEKPKVNNNKIYIYVLNIVICPGKNSC